MSAIVNVITVCFNEQDSISRCLRSVFEQDWPDVQYIVIDGGSTDGTAAMIAEHRARLHYFVSEADDGIYSAMNKALGHCTGELVYFLNADDYFFSPQVISRAMVHFDADPDLDILSGRVQFFNTPSVNGKPYVRDDFSYAGKLDLYRSPIPQQCIFSRRRLFDQLGCFDQRYAMCADYAWLIKAMNHGKKIKQVPDIFSYFDYQGVSFTSNNQRKREKNLIILRNSNLWELLVYAYRGLRGRLIAQ